MRKLHDEVYKIIRSKNKNTSKDEVCGFVGDLINMEASFIFKEFFERTLESKCMILDQQKVLLNFLIGKLPVQFNNKWN